MVTPYVRTSFFENRVYRNVKESFKIVNGKNKRQKSNGIRSYSLIIGWILEKLGLAKKISWGNKQFYLNKKSLFKWICRQELELKSLKTIKKIQKIFYKTVENERKFSEIISLLKMEAKGKKDKQKVKVNEVNKVSSNTKETEKSKAQIPGVRIDELSENRNTILRSRKKNYNKLHKSTVEIDSESKRHSTNEFKRVQSKQQRRKNRLSPNLTKKATVESFKSKNRAVGKFKCSKINDQVIRINYSPNSSKEQTKRTSKSNSRDKKEKNSFIQKVHFLVSIFKMKKGFHELGVFRKSADKTKVENLLRALKKKKIKDIKFDYDIHTVSSALKYLFREQKSKLFDTVKEIYLNQTIDIREMKIPEEKRDHLVMLLNLLDQVIEHQSLNKMGVENLAKVWGPNVLSISDQELLQLTEPANRAFQDVLEKRAVILNHRKVG